MVPATVEIRPVAAAMIRLFSSADQNSAFANSTRYQSKVSAPSGKLISALLLKENRITSSSGCSAPIVGHSAVR